MKLHMYTPENRRYTLAGLEPMVLSSWGVCDASEPRNLI
jgi:hypothetical protein